MTALAFLATIEDPTRFRRPRAVGAYIGLTPKRYRSGERDVSGGISRQGDAMARHYLYEAANCLLPSWGGRSAVKRWGLGLAKRIGAKKARVAVARKLACLLLRLWRDGAHYREDAFQTARAMPTPLAGPSPSGDAGSTRRDESETVGCRQLRLIQSTARRFMREKTGMLARPGQATPKRNMTRSKPERPRPLRKP